MITVDALTKRFRSRPAVDRLSFEVKPGLVTGFLGPNGAGKSTTIRMILGLDTPDGGHALVDGVRYRALDRPLRTVGSLLDAGALHGGRTARQHLAHLAAATALPRSRVRDVLTYVGLDAVADRRVRGFSLGMRQRLGVAAALLGDPPILIFDEPVNGLDPEGIVWIRTLMRSLAAEGRTVLVSSHLMSEMALTADHLIVIGRGRLLADTGMAELIEAGSREEVLVRTADAALLARLLHAEGASVTPEPDGALLVGGLDAETISGIAAGAGTPVHELTRRRSSLEEVYLTLTDPAVEYRTERAAS
jgi:ABC-2 type transport system ATP-binding protein